MGTLVRAQPARLPIPLTCPLPQHLVVPLWRGEEPAEDLPRRPVPDDAAVGVLPHQLDAQTLAHAELTEMVRERLRS